MKHSDFKTHEDFKAYCQKRNYITTTHTITHRGKTFVIKGHHEMKYNLNSKMTFSVFLDGHGVGFSKNNLRERMDGLISDSIVRAERERYYNSRKGLTVAQVISHVDFAYARYSPNISKAEGGCDLGAYYKLYMKDKYSPTGVSLNGGCTEEEWETLSKASGNSHNYLSPTEDLRTAR